MVVKNRPKSPEITIQYYQLLMIRPFLAKSPVDGCLLQKCICLLCLKVRLVTGLFAVSGTLIYHSVFIWKQVPLRGF